MKLFKYKSKPKKAMTLLTILATMLVVMGIIVAATPIITKRINHITTGRAENGKIRLKQTNGLFACFKINGILHEARLDAGATDPVIHRNINACTFQIPNNAEEFEITLIGGGGGGAGTSAQLLTNKIETDSVVFGLNSISINPFRESDYYGDINALNSFNSILDSLPAARKPFIDVSGARPAGQGGVVGQNGGTCRAVLQHIERIPENITYASGTAESPNGRITHRLGNILANSGSEPLLFDGSYVTYQACYSKQACKVEHSLPKSDANGQNKTDNRGIGQCSMPRALNDYFTVSRTGATPNATYMNAANGAAPTTSNRLNLGLYQYTLNVLGSGAPAQPGEVSINKASSLGSANTLTIPKNNIGNGGAGGAAGAQGNNGGRTFLTIETRTGNVSYQALGGNGGTTQGNTVIFDPGQNGTPGELSIAGANGVSPTVAIPSVFVNNMNELRNTTIGQGGQTTCAIARTAPCAGSASTTIGASGGNAAISYSISNSGTFMEVDGAPRARTTVTRNFTRAAGGRGADGAIIIRW